MPDGLGGFFTAFKAAQEAGKRKKGQPGANDPRGIGGGQEEEGPPPGFFGGKDGQTWVSDSGGTWGAGKGFGR